MSPEQQGFVKCVRCGCWRRQDGVRAIEWVSLPGDVVTQGHQCSNDAVCGRLAGVGQGRLDADVGQPSTEVPTKEDK